MGTASRAVPRDMSRLRITTNFFPRAESGAPLTVGGRSSYRQEAGAGRDNRQLTVFTGPSQASWDPVGTPPQHQQQGWAQHRPRGTDAQQQQQQQQGEAPQQQGASIKGGGYSNNSSRSSSSNGPGGHRNSRIAGAHHSSRSKGGVHKRGGGGYVGEEGQGACDGSNSSQACRNSHTSQAGRPAATAVEHTAAAIDKKEFGEVNPDFLFCFFYVVWTLVWFPGWQAGRVGLRVLKRMCRYFLRRIRIRTLTSD